MAAEREGAGWGLGSIRKKIQQWESLDEASPPASTVKRPTLSKQPSLGRLEEKLPTETRYKSPESGRRSARQTTSGETRRDSWKTNGVRLGIGTQSSANGFDKSEVIVRHVNGYDSKTERIITHREQTQDDVKKVESTEIRVNLVEDEQEVERTPSSPPPSPLPQRKKAIAESGPELHAPELVALLLGRGVFSGGDTKGDKIEVGDPAQEIRETTNDNDDNDDDNEGDDSFTSDWHFVESSDLQVTEKYESSDETIELEADEFQENNKDHSESEDSEEVESGRMSRGECLLERSEEKDNLIRLAKEPYIPESAGKCADEDDGGGDEGGNENENEIAYTTDMVGPCMMAIKDYEPESSTSTSSFPSPALAPLVYRKVKSHATLKPDWCDIKLTALLYLRGINAKRQFRIATSVEGAGSFGDIVFKHKTEDGVWQTCFIQLKHKDTVALTNEALTAVDSSFSLSEDYKSYCEIRDRMSCDSDEDVFSGSFDECRFVLHTSAVLSERMASRRRPGSNGGIEKLLKSGSNDDKVFSLGEDSDRDIYSAMGDKLRAFLKSLVIFSGQPSEIEVDHLVKMELRAACSKYLSNVHIIYRFFIEAVQQWWSGDPNYLTQKINVLDKAENILNVYNLTASQKHALRLHEVSFRPECTEPWRLEVRKANSLLFIATTGLTSKFSCTKLLQVLREENVECIFTSLQALLQQDKEVITEWASGQKDLLVIVSESTSDDEDDLCSELCQVFANKPDKQLIVLSPPCNSFVTNFQSKFSCPYEEIFDPFDILQLDKDTTEQLLEREVRLQGYPIFLKCVIGDDVQLISQVLTSDNFDTLINGSTINLGKELHGRVYHYVKRSLERRNIITADILRSDVPGVIAVSNITVEKLRRLVPDGAAVGQASEPNTDAYKFLVLDSFDPAEDFERICETREDSVHWLRRSRGKLVWQRSRHDLVSLALFKDGVISRQTPENVFDLEDRVILVAAERNSGKSALLTHLALETKQSDPSMWVIKADLGACITLFENCSDEELNAVVFLSTLENDDTDFLGVDLLTFCVEKLGNVAVFLDGFDNVVPIYLDKVLALLASLLATKVRKIFITCDPSMQELMENRLSTFAYRLCPDQRVEKVMEENARESYV